jgi:hypothetical protein
MENSIKSPQSIDCKVLTRIVRRGRGSVVVPGEFLDLGSRQAIDLVLHRLTKKGTIRRLARGLYDYPKQHPALGTLTPSADVIARALAGRDRTRLQPGNERVKVTHPERVKVTHLEIQNGRSGQKRQTCFTPTCDPSLFSSTPGSDNSHHSSQRCANDASGGLKAPQSCAHPGRSDPTR